MDGSFRSCHRQGSTSVAAICPSPGDHVAIQDEPLDPRPVDRLRMDLHDRHAPSRDSAPAVGTATTIVAARMRVSRGNTGGERPSARGVPPGLARIEDKSSSTNATRARRAHPATADRRAGCSPSSSGGALCRPPGGATAERSPTAVPWRERPPEMAAWLPSLRPRTWSLTPR